MPQTDRERIADTLRTLAPGHTAGRIWGRREGAAADEGVAGNVWAADVEDIAALIADALAAPVHPAEPRRTPVR